MPSAGRIPTTKADPSVRGRLQPAMTGSQRVEAICPVRITSAFADLNLDRK
jgi:hypothetical protein